MLTKRRFIIMHTDGYPVTLRLDPTKDISAAARFHDELEANGFLHGYYGPSDPSEYLIVPIKISYELESEEDEQIAG